MASRKTGRPMGNALKDFERLKDKEMSEWARTFLEAQSGVDKIPKGFYTEKELAEKFNFSQSGIRAHLNQLKKKKMLEEKKFRVVRGERQYRVSHYKLKRKSK